MMSIEIDNMDNQTVISDITDINTVNSGDIDQKIYDLRVKIETDLNKINIEGLKEKCKEMNISGISKQKKTEIIQTLLTEFNKLIVRLKEKKSNELKNICKQYNIKCSNSAKKDTLICNILEYSSLILKFKIDEVTHIQEITINNEQTKPSEEPKLSIIEDLEKQRQEIELKMKEEIERQKRIDEEIKQKAEAEEKKKIEEQKRIEKEEAKKKKQSIPKQVRVIVWNHYIGEDIIKHKCLCCKKVTITNTNFDVGHVLSEKNGGTHEINNLRPICGACNHSMGSENMIDFVVKYGLYIG
jgi:5-methylcytosine-specific restriction endonuclease McrA